MFVLVDVFVLKLLFVLVLSTVDVDVLILLLLLVLVEVTVLVDVLMLLVLTVVTSWATATLGIENNPATMLVIITFFILFAPGLGCILFNGAN